MTKPEADAVCHDSGEAVWRSEGNESGRIPAVVIVVTLHRNADSRRR